MSVASLKLRLRAGIILMMLGFFLLGGRAWALTDPTKFPRIGNQYLRAGIDITAQTIPLLARYDLVVLPAEAQIQNPDLFAELRRQNPDILLFAYVPTLTFNRRFWRDELHKKLLARITDTMWLQDDRGNRLVPWPDTEALNMTTDWQRALPEYVARDVLGSGLWDGVFYDEVDPCIICRNNGNVDTNRDGLSDALEADAAWRTGYARMLRLSRELFGPERLIIINGTSEATYQPHINGRMFESFPTPWEGNGSWETVMASYRRLEREVGYRPIFFLGADTSNTGNHTNYRDLRFKLTSTLLGNGYFGYSFGTEDHGQLWWYDEYDVALGRPTSTPHPNPLPQGERESTSVWRRDFEKGVVLVNAANTRERVRLGDDFEKIHGNQDPVTNDGSIVNLVRLEPYDGLILLRLNEEIHDAAFTNGAFTRIVNKEGETVRTGFFLFDNRFAGGSELIRADLDDDGLLEAVVSYAGRVSILDSTGQRATFAPYGESYRREVRIAVGDLDGDGKKEIVTSAGPGGGPHVRIWDHTGKLRHKGFFPFDKNNRGGVTVAAADIDGDGKDEIITGAGRGLPPEVKIWKSEARLPEARLPALQTSFQAYAPGFRGGIVVAAGDIDGDGRAEIITGTNPGGGPHVRTFKPNGEAIGKGFFPYDKNRRDGVRVGVTDMDGNGIMEILAMTENP